MHCRIITAVVVTRRVLHEIESPYREAMHLGTFPGSDVVETCNSWAQQILWLTRQPYLNTNDVLLDIVFSSHMKIYMEE